MCICNYSQLKLSCPPHSPPANKSQWNDLFVKDCSSPARRVVGIVMEGVVIIVSCQVAAVGKAFDALGAYEQFGPRVRVHVTCQVAALGEAFATLGAYE